MENIERMKPSQTYEVMDLWLRTTIHSNSFVEENFWGNTLRFCKRKIHKRQKKILFTSLTARLSLLPV